jgi:NAD(P)H-dependent flavin oxidoreductase YrpB (nitropropane dioxygenase family)
MLASGNARKFWMSTRVAQQLGIDYPIIRAPFGGLPSQRLTATVSNLGGLGSLGAVTLGSSAISEVIAEIRGLTSKPFAINLGRTAQRQRAHRDVAAAGVGRGGSVAEERGGPAATGSTAADGKPGPCKRAGRFRRTPECAYVSAVEVARCP